MKIAVRFFSYLQQAADASLLEREMARESSLADLLHCLQQEFPALARLLPGVTVTLNRQVADRQTLLAENDEVALLPPITGGCGAAVRRAAIGPTQRRPRAARHR